MSAMAGERVFLDLAVAMMEPFATAPYLGASALMWSVMMIAMMGPAVLPVLLVFQRLHRGFGGRTSRERDRLLDSIAIRERVDSGSHDRARHIYSLAAARLGRRRGRDKKWAPVVEPLQPDDGAHGDHGEQNEDEQPTVVFQPAIHFVPRPA
jgi:hypothetical protein